MNSTFLSKPKIYGVIDPFNEDIVEVDDLMLYLIEFLSEITLDFEFISFSIFPMFK